MALNETFSACNMLFWYSNVIEKYLVLVEGKNSVKTGLEAKAVDLCCLSLVVLQLQSARGQVCQRLSRVGINRL